MGKDSLIMKFRSLLWVILILALSCDIGCKEATTSQEQFVRIIKERFKDAKVMHPGLGCTKDTIATQIIIFEKGVSINEFLYPGEFDTIWDQTIMDKLLMASQYTDTTIDVARGDSDIVIYRQWCPGKFC